MEDINEVFARIDAELAQYQAESAARVAASVARLRARSAQADASLLGLEDKKERNDV